ncbi:hypothetical protein [Rubidibacter lacunae]|uniref:hypothetical protein n=1 Tax=Rubidibacter lacunae TaxID=582514 RepID=UPI0012EB5724|nr:hypothetical protein [Rubidibacter lacunae]
MASESLLTVTIPWSGILTILGLPFVFFSKPQVLLETPTVEMAELPEAAFPRHRLHRSVQPERLEAPLRLPHGLHPRSGQYPPGLGV